MRFVLLMVVLSLGAAAATAAPSSPGGRFEERLKVAAKRTRPPVRRATATTRKLPVRRTVRTATRRTPVYTRSYRRSYTSLGSTRTRTRRGYYRSQPSYRYSTASRHPQVAAAQRETHPGTFTYSVDPRDRASSNMASTGDMILFADTGKDVRFTWEGQQRVTRHPLILKGYLPQMLKVNAQPTSGGARTEAWVPIRANCITTVRFKLR